MRTDILFTRTTQYFTIYRRYFVLKFEHEYLIQHSLTAGGTKHSLTAGGTKHSLTTGGTKHSLTAGGTKHSLTAGGTKHYLTQVKEPGTTPLKAGFAKLHVGLVLIRLCL
jgi:hypothetical protein